MRVSLAAMRIAGPKPSDRGSGIGRFMAGPHRPLPPARTDAMPWR